jgi:hypothetical protein
MLPQKFPAIKRCKFILIILTSALLGSCSGSGKDENKPPTPPAITKQRPAETAKPAEPIFEGPGTLLVKELDGWVLDGPPRYFGPDNLYDLINGGAEIYVAYGMRKMVTADYKNKAAKGIVLTTEIYDMGTPLGAFGKLSNFATGLKDPSKAGAGLPAELQERGILGSSDIKYWKDRYVVHITLIDESPEANIESMKSAGAKYLPPLAGAIASKIKENPPPSAELALFPNENRIPRSDAYELERLAGLAGFGPGFSVRYKSEDAEWVLFITNPFDDMKQLESLLAGSGSATSLPQNTQLKRAGNRIIGFTTNAEKWSEDQQKYATKQLALIEESLKK